MKKLFSLMLIAAAFALSAKPLAIVTANAYAKYNSQLFINRILHPARIAYVTVPKMPSPEKYNDFSSIWVFSHCNTLTPAEFAALNKYVADGGMLVLTSGAVRGMTGAKFAKSDFKHYKIVKMNRWPKMKLDIVQKDHPIFAGIDPKDPAPYLRSSRFLVEPLPPTKVLAGNANLGTITETRIGKGVIYYVYEAHFFPGRYNKLNYPVVDKLLKNLLKMRKHSSFADIFRQKHPGKDMLIWQRKWQHWPEERPHFEPEYPQAGEIVKKLEFFSAIDERDTRFFIVQSGKNMSVELKVSGKNFTLLRMSKATPQYDKLRKKQPKKLAEAEGNYFLRDFSGKIKLEAGVPEVFAIRVNTENLTPGKYSGTLKCGKETIPLSLQVYPVMLGKKRPIAYRTWGSTLPLTPAGVKMLKTQNISQASIPFSRTTNLYLKSTGKTIHHSMWGNRKLLDSGTFPELKIPASYLEYARAMAKNGINCLQYTHIHSVNATIASVCKEKNLPTNKWSEKHKNLYLTFYSQIVNYFRDRGVRDVIMMGFNEPKPKDIREHFLPMGKLLSDLDVKLGASWTYGTFNDPKLVQAISPYAYWSCYTVVAPELKRLIDSGEVKLPAENLCGYYVGSTPETRRPSEYGRSYGRYFFYLGQNFTYAHIGPFWKSWIYYDDNPVYGVTGQRLFDFGDNKEKVLLSSAFVEGVRDGLDDSNIFYILEYYRNQLAKVNSADAKRAVKLFDAAKARWLKELAFISHKRQSGNKPYEYVRIGKDFTPERSEYFKKELLDLLMAIKPAVKKYIKPQISFRGIDLSDGAEISGGTLPGIVNKKGAKAKIMIKIDPAMPKGDFSAKAAGNTITISGADAAALQYGIRAFENIVISKGDWLL